MSNEWTTGIPGLDTYAKPEAMSLWLIASPPGMGKTARTLDMAAAAYREGRRVMILSYEMAALHLLTRLGARGVALEDVPRPRLAIRSLARGTPLPEADITTFAPDLLIVDTLSAACQQVGVSYLPSVVADAAQMLAGMALDRNCCIVTTAQTGRSMDPRGDTQRLLPTYEKVDVALLCHCPYETPRPYIIDVVKNGRGQLGRITLRLVPSEARAVEEVLVA